MTIEKYLIFSFMLLVIGLAGIIVNRRNIIILLMCIEMILLSVNTNFIIFSYFYNSLIGQVFVFFILGVAAVEATIGLAILVILFRKYKSIDIDVLSVLKG